VLAFCFLIVLQFQSQIVPRSSHFKMHFSLLHNSLRYDLFIINFLFLLVYEFVCVQVLKFIASALVQLPWITKIKFFW
jgi:hypothetical protein